MFKYNRIKMKDKTINPTEINFVYISDDKIYFKLLVNNQLHIYSFDDIRFIDGIVIQEHYGIWYTIDATIKEDKIYFLLEHEEYGDETPCLIIDIDGNIIIDNVYNGFDDLDDYFILKGGDI